MAEGIDSGDGKISPFGDHYGAPEGGRDSGVGANFVKDPRGGRTATAPENPMKSVPQRAGNPHYNPSSVPAGGAVYRADPRDASNKTLASGNAKPYRVS